MSDTIYSLARINLPVSWDILANSSSYGSTLLQSKVDFVKYRLFSTIVNATVEETVYNPLEMHYAAKQTALQVIPVAIDYYKNQRQTITTTGTSETVSYPDRIRALEKLQELFTKEVTDLALDLPSTSITKRRRKVLPKYNTTEFVTEDPLDFPQKTITNTSDNLPWDISS